MRKTAADLRASVGLGLAPIALEVVGDTADRDGAAVWEWVRAVLGEREAGEGRDGDEESRGVQHGGLS